MTPVPKNYAKAPPISLPHSPLDAKNQKKALPQKLFPINNYTLNYNPREIPLMQSPPKLLPTFSQNTPQNTPTIYLPPPSPPLEHSSHQEWKAEKNWPPKEANQAQSILVRNPVSMSKKMRGAALCSSLRKALEPLTNLKKVNDLPITNPLIT